MSESACVHVVVTDGPPDAIARTWKSVDAQSWRTVDRVWPVATPGPDEVLAVLAAGTQLETTALEKAWWYLHTHPDAAFVTGIDTLVRDGGLARSVAAFVVVRARDAQLVSDAEWRADALAPGLSLVLARLAHASARGRQLVELTHGRGANAAVDARVNALAAAGLTDALLGDGGGDPPLGVLPMQSIAEHALPSATVRRMPTRGRRVLALFQGFPMGGYTAFNADMLPRLVARGHAVTVCTTEWWRTNWMLDNVREATTDIFHAHGMVPGAHVPRFIDWLITSRGIEVVFLSHSFAAYRCLPWLRARHPKVAFVDYVHTDWFETQMYGSYAEMSASHTDWLDVQLASSGALACDLVGRGADAGSVRKCPINIDPTHWDPARYRNRDVRTSLRAGEATTLVLFAARVSGEKRPLLALDLVRALREEGHDVRLVVAGQGPLLPAMVKAAGDAGLKDACEFLGELDPDKLRFVYANCDVYCVPSEIEGIARTLYEAMSMALPVVAADVGGQRELVNDKCGAVIAPTSHEREDYLAALRRFLVPATRRAAGNAARARIVAEFSSAQCVKTIEEGFTLALARRAERQAVLPTATAREFATLGLEVQRRHTLRAAGR